MARVSPFGRVPHVDAETYETGCYRGVDGQRSGAYVVQETWRQTGVGSSKCCETLVIKLYKRPMHHSMGEARRALGRGLLRCEDMITDAGMEAIAADDCMPLVICLGMVP